MKKNEKCHAAANVAQPFFHFYVYISHFSLLIYHLIKI